MSSTTGSPRLALLAGVCLIFAFVFFVLGSVLVIAGVRHRSTPAADAPSNEAASDDNDSHESGGLFSSLRRAVSSDGPAEPGYTDGHPVGLYLMTKYWIATGGLEKSVWYFTKDGKAYVDPQEGFTDEKLSSARLKGTIDTDGGTMTIHWNDGSEEKSKLERNEGGFAWDTGLYAPVGRFDDPSQLVGRWEGGESISVSGNSAMTSKTLDIHEDGTFTREAVASFTNRGDESTAHAGSQGSSAGKWSLEGNTLTLTFDNGDVVRGITFPFDSDNTRRFYFSGTMYKKLS